MKKPWEYNAKCAEMCTKHYIAIVQYRDHYKAHCATKLRGSSQYLAIIRQWSQVMPVIEDHYRAHVDLDTLLAGNRDGTEHKIELSEQLPASHLLWMLESIVKETTYHMVETYGFHQQAKVLDEVKDELEDCISKVVDAESEVRKIEQDARNERCKKVLEQAIPTPRSIVMPSSSNRKTEFEVRCANDFVAMTAYIEHCMQGFEGLSWGPKAKESIARYWSKLLLAISSFYRSLLDLDPSNISRDPHEYPLSAVSGGKIELSSDAEISDAYKLLIPTMVHACEDLDRRGYKKEVMELLGLRRTSTGCPREE